MYQTIHIKTHLALSIIYYKYIHAYNIYTIINYNLIISKLPLCNS